MHAASDKASSDTVLKEMHVVSDETASSTTCYREAASCRGERGMVGEFAWMEEQLKIAESMLPGFALWKSRQVEPEEDHLAKKDQEKLKQAIDRAKQRTSPGEAAAGRAFLKQTLTEDEYKLVEEAAELEAAEHP